jgi:integrase
VLKTQLNEEINAIRAAKKQNAPVVLTREETATLLSLMGGVPLLVAKLLYGSGLRISEAIRLRVQDIDFQMKTLTVRSGKGNKDRVTTFPGKLSPFLKDHLKTVKTMHQKDIEQGYGEVYLPHALSRKYIIQLR